MSMAMRKSTTMRLSLEGKKDPESEERVPLGIYLSWIKNELDSESACLELPFTIILLLSFSVLAYLHLRQASIFIAEGAIRFDIEENANFAWAVNFGHKTIHDVNSIADFWSWLRIGFLPLMVQHSWGYSESLQDGYNIVQPSSPFSSGDLPGARPALSQGESAVLPVRDDYLHYNRIIGGFRLRQERSPIGWEHCRMPTSIPEATWKKWLGKPCVPASPAYELHPQVTDAESFGTPERLEWLLSAVNPVRQLQRKTVDMEDGCSNLTAKIPSDPNYEGGDPIGGNGECLCTTCSEGSDAVGPWIDERTQRVEITFVVFNWEYGLYSMVSVNFFFNRGGRIFKLVDVGSAWANSFPGGFWEVCIMGACDCIWVLSLTYILVCEIAEVVKVIRSSKSHWWTSLWQDYVEFWNTVDWISITVAYFVVACWFRTFLATREVNANFEELAKVDPLATSRADYTVAVEEFVDLVDEMLLSERLYRMSFMFYPMVVMLRLFKSFDAQPRLAVVTRTLVVATQDMIHFFIIFFSCYFCMVVNAVLLFGQDVENFSTLDRATITCFRTLFGDWDYQEMKEVGLLQCAIWFWTFLLILFMILLNILLAILMDAYGEVQSNAANKLSLPKQISEMVRRFRQTQLKQRVKLNDIWAAYFKEIGDEKDMLTHEPCPGYTKGTGGRQFISPDDIIEHVSKYMRQTVPLNQAKRGIKSAKQQQVAKEIVSYTLEDVDSEMVLFETLTRQVRDLLCKITDIMTAYDFDELDEEFIQKIPDKPLDDCTENSTLMADAVKGVVTTLADEISGTLSKETEVFAKRQKSLEESQAEMLITARDASTTLEKLRLRTDDIVRDLQQMALHRQRTAAGRAATAASVAASVLANLGSGPCTMPLSSSRSPSEGM